MYKENNFKCVKNSIMYSFVTNFKVSLLSLFVNMWKHNF